MAGSPGRQDAHRFPGVADALAHRAGIEASSFFWAYFVGLGVVAYIILYLVYR